MVFGRHRALALLLSCVVLFCISGNGGAAAPVLIVTSERGGAYGETMNALRDGLTGALHSDETTDIDWQEFDERALQNRRIVVTIGSLAAHAVNGRTADVAVLNILLPRAAFETLPNRTRNGNSSAIFLDQPVARQIAAISVALPDWNRLVLIAGPQTGALADALATTARSAGFDVLTTQIRSERELYRAMQSTLSTPAILLAVPDRQIFNSHTIQNILLTSYRHRSPLVGFSPAYVRAGALLAVYSTPAQIGAQAAETVRAMLEGQELPPPRYPSQFEIGINATVARSLGIHLDDAEAIAARVKQLERSR